jgi:hypothetical protein
LLKHQLLIINRTRQRALNLTSGARKQGSRLVFAI